MKKNVIMILVLILIAIFGIKAFAKTVYDMQKINVNVNKPKSNFKIEYVDEKGERKESYANSSFYDSDLNDFDMPSNSLTLLKGTKIKIIDESEAGDGSKISRYDFQIYTPTDSELINTQSKIEVEKEIVLSEVGRYDLYMSVMDDYKNIQGFDNWSINGNHRWLGENQKNKDQMFYWYFSQLTINVVDEIIEDEEIIDEPIEEIDEENHAPEVEILAPNIFYPNEILDGKNIANNVSWMYFDEDKDEMEVSGYQLYKIENNRKNLIDENDSITKRKDMTIDIRGEMNDRYELDVYVVDSEGNRANDSLTIKISELKPRIEIDMYDRCYLFDEIKPQVKLIEDGINEYLNIKYENYYIEDSKGNRILSSFGKVETILVDEKFFENETYTLVQEYKNSYGTKYSVLKSLYVVEIERPVVLIDNSSLYYDEECEMKVDIAQPQSRLKGMLPDYNYEFEDGDAHYELYLDNKKIYEHSGIIKTFYANERMNIEENDKDTNYKVYQYVKNDRGKEGVGIANVLVKKISDSYIDVEILERDNDPTTIENEIYKNESLNIKTNFYAKRNESIIEKGSYILDANNNKYYEQKDFYNGLKQMNLDEGYYKIVCYYKTEEQTFEDIEEFIVKKISAPVIEKFNVPNYKITKLDLFDFKYKVCDVNKSEEHPYGFELINSYQINDKKSNGVFNELNIKELKSNNTYEIKQTSINKEHQNVNNVDKIEFYLENIHPEINFKGKEEYYAGENVEIEVEGIDKDGYIKTFETFIETDLIDDLKVYDEKINEQKVIKHILFRCLKEGNFIIKGLIVDDSEDEVEDSFMININDSDFYPYIELLTNEEKRFKENRYMRIKYGATNGADSILLFDGSQIKFTDNVFENEFIKMIIEKDGTEKEVGLYFKKKGTYKLEAQPQKEEIKSKARSLTFDIKEDLTPVVTLRCDEYIYRSEETNAAKTKLDYDIESDDSIGEIVCYINDEIVDMKDDIVTFKYNELGTKNIYLVAKEVNDCLPCDSHPFYEELVSKQKVGRSNNCLVQIINRAPLIEYNGVSNKYKINIIE